MGKMFSIMIPTMMLQSETRVSRWNMSSQFLVKFWFENDVTMKRAQKHVATQFGTC